MTRLLGGYDGILLDLDGTVYRGRLAIPGAVPAVHAVRQAGAPVGYVTNNASRGSAEIAEQLTSYGFTVEPAQVVTSAQAGAALLAERLDAGATVLIVGTDALAAEVKAVGLVPVRTAGEAPDAVVQGHSPTTGWPDLAEACLAIRTGALWVACNVDPTLPTERGELPGNGSMVAALRAATGLQPLVAGKPQRRLLDQAAARLSAHRPLVVGDRLDTDVAGACAAGMDALLVLTGVSGPADLLAAPPEQRPRFVAADLSSLLAPAAESEITTQPGWTVELAGTVATLAASSHPNPDPVAALRALCAASWAASTVPSTVRAADETARAALAVLALP